MHKISLREKVRAWPEFHTKLDYCNTYGSFSFTFSYRYSVILDVNTQLYPMSLGDKFRLLLTTTLREDGVPDDGDFLTMGKYCLFCPLSSLPERN